MLFYTQQLYALIGPPILPVTYHHNVLNKIEQSVEGATKREDWLIADGICYMCVEGMTAISCAQQATNGIVYLNGDDVIIALTADVNAGITMLKPVKFQCNQSYNSITDKHSGIWSLSILCPAGQWGTGTMCFSCWGDDLQFDPDAKSIPGQNAGPSDCFRTEGKNETGEYKYDTPCYFSM